MTPAIKIQDDVQLPVGMEQAWATLTDPTAVVRCIPGAEIIATEPDGTIHGALRMSLGPTETRFEGRVTATFDDQSKTGQLDGRGADGRGRTRATVDTNIRLQPVPDQPDCTHMTVTAAVVVSGALAAFARAGGQTVARRMLEDFAENMARMHACVPTDADAGHGRPRSDTSAADLSAVRLVLRAFRDRIRRAFARWTGRDNSRHGSHR